MQDWEEQLTHEVFHPSKEFSAQAWVTPESYRKDYAASIEDPSSFWAKTSREHIHWSKPFTKVLDGDFSAGEVRWFADGETNLSYNCIDRHLDKHGDKTAIRWIGNQTDEQRTLTYRQLHHEVVKFSSALVALGVGRGDRVAIYMPMVPEAAIAMLGCARIGAVHSVVFAGFSSKSLRDRIDDCGARWVITANESPRGSHATPLKKIVDEALAVGTHTVEKVVVLERTPTAFPRQPGRDITWYELLSMGKGDCAPVPMSSEDPLFILYTSGSTGKPKGLLHTTGGYLTFVTATFRWVFDIKPTDLFWCTADVGWITGHSYIVYGPLSNGASVLMFEGVPTWPDAGRFWQIIENERVTIFYTAPTALRALMKLGDDWVTRHSRSSLRLLGTVGEPINPKAWLWYHSVVGEGKLPIVDTWWQTETGGIMVSPMPGATALKPGSATKPIFGIDPGIVEPETGKLLSGAATGAMTIRTPWPGMARTIYGDHKRYVETYFSTYKGSYFTGDGASRDADGDYRISGRIDDVINVSGHRLGTFEIESALVSHKAVAEAAVVGVPHDIKGQAIYAYVTLKDRITYTDLLKTELIQHVRKEIGPIATPERIHWAPGLPKTRSGKIMRRILRKIAVGETDSLGDITTLAEPKVVEDLLKDQATADR